MNFRVPSGVGACLLFAAGVLVANVAAAASQRLQCTLTDTDAQREVERRPIAIVFDEDAGTMRLLEGGRTRVLKNVSISMTSMSGADAEITVGVSRSSLSVVLQTYQKNSVQTEYGNCAIDVKGRPSTPSPARQS